MNRRDFRYAWAALAAPFQRLGTFLRCAILPFLACMAFPAFITLLEIAYPSAHEKSMNGAPVFVQCLIFLLLGLGLLSLISFSIAWRRSLGLSIEERGPGSLLTIDSRTFVYLFVRLGLFGSYADAVSRPDAGKPAPSWLRMVLGALGLLLTGLVFVFGGMIALVATVIGFAAHGLPIQLLFSAISSCGFTYFWLVSSDWAACRRAALNALGERVPEQPVSGLRFFVLGPIVTSFFFALSVGLPALSHLGEPRSLPTIAVWLGALLLSIAWFAGLETLPFVRTAEHPKPNAAKRGGGHRSFRSPTPPQQA